jgi:hypothetical protein
VHTILSLKIALEVFNIFFPPVGDLITVPVNQLGAPDVTAAPILF